MIASLQHLSSALSNILDKWDLWNILTKIPPAPLGYSVKGDKVMQEKDIASKEEDFSRSVYNIFHTYIHKYN